MEVYKSKYLTQIHHKESSILEGIWSDNGEMTDEEYREEMLNTITTNEKCKPKAILIDTRNFQLGLVPETQEWVNTEVFPKVIALGVQKMAFLLTQELFAQISIEQTMDEETAKQGFQTKFFENREKAIEWTNE